MMEQAILYYVVPCYNEEEVLQETAGRLRKKLFSLMEQGKIGSESRIVFVNDGSRDRTWEIITRLHEEDPVFSGICLSCNRGHQNALLAGLSTVYPFADMVISMDADLQDDIDASDEMIDRFHAGADIVYGVRSSRATDTVFKRSTAKGFYKVMGWLGTRTIPDHADFRLMSSRAVEALMEFGEVNLFLRGMVPMVGFQEAVVYYQRGERFAGESKYPLKKMIGFAIQGITSLSTRPLQLITQLGFMIFLISIAMLIYSLIRHFMGATIVGWTTLMISTWAIGGLILLALGVIGEYIGRIYLETKARPRFIIREFLDEGHGFTYGIRQRFRDPARESQKNGEGSV